MRVVLPVETKVRELKGKLWLALHLVNEGHTVIIGEENDVVENLHKLNPDIYFRNSAVYTEARLDRLTALCEAGCKVLILDTEGGIYRSEDVYLKRLSQLILDQSDKFLAWGQSPANILRQHRTYPEDQIAVTGNPRFDLVQEKLREVYSEEARELQCRYGEFILVNTNFSLANVFQEKKFTSKIDEETYQDQSHVEYQEELLRGFQAMVRSLTEDFPDFNILVRPHPSENHGTYEREFRALDSVFMEHYGDVRSWIYASKAVIHNGCTTGIEAALMETPVFAYRPVTADEFDFELPNRVSVEAFNYDELRHAVEANLGETYVLSNSELELLKGHIDNLSSFSTEKIVREVETIAEKQRSPTGRYTRKPPLEIRAKRALMDVLGVDRAEQLLSYAGLSSYSYKRQKFPGLDMKELRDEVALFDDYIDTDNVSIEAVPRPGDIYELEPQDWS